LHRNVAFVGLFPYKQLPLARRLEADGVQVFWVVRWASEASFLRENGVPAERVLDTSTVDPRTGDLAAYERELAELEFEGAPRMANLILMDRFLRRYDHDFCIRYLGKLNRCVSEFLRANAVTLVTLVHDMALQLLTISICRRMGVLAVVPTKTRLPPMRYFFGITDQAREMLPIRPVEPDDVAQAEAFLASFRDARPETRAQFWKAETGITDLLTYLPGQLRFMGRALSWARKDAGVRHNRWTVVDLARMYVAKRRNLLWLKATRPYAETPGRKPYFLYALHMQPESTVDVLGAYFSDQLALLRQIARSLPATHDLYVKIHSGDAGGRGPGFFQELRAIPGVVVIGPQANTRALLEQASIVFTVTGTIAFEAGLLGRPAVTFAPMFFNELPTVHLCETPTRLPRLIERLLREPEEADDARVVQFLAKVYANSFPGEHNRLTGPLTPAELDGVVGVYRILFRKAAPAVDEPALVPAGAR
jgi:hypothetical protein